MSIVASSNPTLGGTTTLTAIVTGPDGGTKPAGVMAWTVTNPAGASVVCTTTTATVTPSDPTIATAYSCTFPTITAGTYTAQANFPGDANYQLANSSTINIVVAKALPTLSVTASQSSTSSGQTITFTATIAGAAGSVAPTGSPTWALTGASSSCASTTGPIVSSVSSIYTCTVAATLAGTYTAAITYSGDSNYLTSGPSTPYGIDVAKVTPTVTITTSASTAALGSTFVFTATVAGPTSGATPTGTVSWSITGVAGGSCSGTSGPIGTTNTVIYTCTVTATSAGVYVPTFHL